MVEPKDKHKEKLDLEEKDKGEDKEEKIGPKAVSYTHLLRLSSNSAISASYAALISATSLFSTRDSTYLG